MKIFSLKNLVFESVFSLLLMGIVLLLSWLDNWVTNPHLMLFTIGIIIIIALFQTVFIWHAIGPQRDKHVEEKWAAKEKLLEEKIAVKENELQEEIKNLKQATDNLSLSKELREKGNIMTTENFKENECKVETVWLVIEDLAIFNKDKGAREFKEFNIENVRKGKTYVYFTSCDCDASVRDYISMATGERIDFQGDIKQEVQVGDGKIEFVLIDPNAFLFLSPITIWFPEDHTAKKKVFLDFPKFPVGYHLVVEDDLAEKIYKRLAGLYKTVEKV